MQIIIHSFSLVNTGCERVLTLIPSAIVAIQDCLRTAASRAARLSAPLYVSEKRPPVACDRIRVTLAWCHTSADMYTVVDAYRTTVLASGILTDLLRKDARRLYRDAVSPADN